MVRLITEQKFEIQKNYVFSYFYEKIQGDPELPGLAFFRRYAAKKFFNAKTFLSIIYFRL
jgi:hypothetical protein